MSALEAGVAYVELVPRLKDGVTQQITKSLSGTVDAAGKKIAAAGGTLAKTITLPIAAGFAAGALKANELNGKLREVVTLTGETGAAADKTFEEFRGKVGKLSNELGIAQTTLTGGLYQALSAGVPRENVFDFMRVAGKAAVAGVTDTETAVDGLTTIINAFGLDAKDASAVADSMFATVKGGKTTFNELSDSLFNVGPAAAAAGVDFKEVNAAIATLTASGTPTSVATTQIRAALVGLQRPSEDLDKIFRKLGYDNAEAAIKAKGLGFALDAVKDASGGSNGKLQTLLGSVEAVGAANVLAGTGAGKFAEEVDRQANAAGSLNDAFGEIDKSRGMDRLKVSLENLAITIGQIVIPVVQRIIDFVTPWIEKFNSADKSTKELITRIAAIAAAVGPGLIAVGKLTSAVGKIGGAAFKGGKAIIGIGKAVGGATGKIASLAAKTVSTAASVGRSFASMAASALKQTAVVVKQIAVQVARWAFMGAQSLLHAGKVALAWLIAAGPIPLIIAAVVGLVALIIKNWDKIRDFTKKVFGYVKAFLLAAWDKIKTVFKTALGLIKGFVMAHFNAIKAVIKTAIDVVKTVIRTAWDTIKTVFKTALDAVKSTVTSAWSRIKELFKAAFDFIKNLFLNWTVPGLLIKHFDKIKATVSGGIDKVKGFFTGLIDFVKGIPDKILAALTGAFDFVKTQAGEVIDAVLGFFRDLPGDITGFVGDIGEAALGIGKAIVENIGKGIAAITEFVGDIASALWNTVKEFVNDKIIEPLRGFTVGGWGPLPEFRPFSALPLLHSGGIVPGQPGQEVMAILKAGELVSTPGQTRRREVAGVGMVNHFYGVDRPRTVIDELARYERSRGRR